MPDSEILIGDCREVLAGMAAGSVQCVVTSPPYWGLRDYGTATWEGGDGKCEHVAPPAGGWQCKVASGEDDPYDRGGNKGQQYRDTCPHCGARRIDSQLGLEPTPEAFIETMVEVFRGVKRVLRDDGTLWLNMGDSYAGGGRGPSTGDSKQSTNVGSLVPPSPLGGLKPKDLVGMPWRLALALQADGWWLRSDIIWAKPNPMPESCTDRPTKSHEYLFLLTKRATYFYDAEAVREKAEYGRSDWQGDQWASSKGVRGGYLVRPGDGSAGRNLRDVWTIPTQSFPGAHFATFPEALVLPCIRAGTSERGCCPECGAAWRRVVEKARTFESGSGKSGNPITGKNGPGLQGGGETGDIRRGPCLHTATLGWQPGCKCYDERYRTEFPQARSARKQQQHDAAGSWWRRVRARPGLPAWPTSPCVVADIFAGACTTGVVCAKENRAFIGIELNPKYAAMGEQRIGKAMRLADDDRRQGTLAFEEPTR